MSTIYEQLYTAILEGASEKTPGWCKRALDQGLTPKDILDNGLVLGMNEVGVRFKAGDMFVPEVLMSAEAMQAGLKILRPKLISSGAKLIGKIVIGTVKGDLHDIGKNLVGMLCEGAGFEVIDLGFNIEPERFIEAVKAHQPQIVGLSALLTTTMRAMGHTIKALEEAGLRDKVKIMVGGAPVDAAFAKRIGADGYGSNAPAGADLAKRLVGAGKAYHVGIGRDSGRGAAPTGCRHACKVLAGHAGTPAAGEPGRGRDADGLRTASRPGKLTRDAAGGHRPPRHAKPGGAGLWAVRQRAARACKSGPAHLAGAAERRLHRHLAWLVRAYMREFQAEPGTYYLTKGWLESGSNPLKEYEELVPKYGAKEAMWLMDQQYRNYKRVALVAHTQADLEQYRPQAQAVARFCERWGMRYEEILGSDDFVRRLLEAATALAQGQTLPDRLGSDFVIVQPGGEIQPLMFVR